MHRKLKKLNIQYSKKGKLITGKIKKDKINIRKQDKPKTLFLANKRVEYTSRTQIMKENETLITEEKKIAKQFGKVFKEILNPQKQHSHSLTENYMYRKTQRFRPNGQ